MSGLHLNFLPFQRLEQPEACPKEYYTIMLKCWQHDPAKRPKFADLMDILPDVSRPVQKQESNF